MPTSLAAFLLVTGVLGLVVVLTSAPLRRLPVTPPLLALTVGVVLGPQGIGWLVLPTEDDHLVLEATRITMAFAVMAVALRFPLDRLRSLSGPLTLLLVVVLPVMAAAVGALGAVVLGLPVAEAALLGACLSPTDPVLASSIVTGEPAEQGLPGRLRRLLTWESGANDGLALPLVLLGITAVHAEGFGSWAIQSLYEVGVGAAMGMLVGSVSGWLIDRRDREGGMERASFLVTTLFLVAGVLGAAQLLSVSGILAVFVAGLAFNHRVSGPERAEEEQIDEGINRVLVLPAFVLVGAFLPWDQLGHGVVAVVVFCTLVLVLRRLPVVYLLRRPLGLDRPAALFVGWFGPMGLAAVYYLMTALTEGAIDLGLAGVGLAVVAASTLVHGVTAVPGRLLYERVRPAAGTEDDGNHEDHATR